MGMPRNYLDRTFACIVKDSCKVGLRHVVTEPWLAVGCILKIRPCAKMTVDAQHNPAIGGGILQIGAQPAEFICSELACVAQVSNGPLRPALVGKNSIIHQNIMDIAEIKRIIAWTECFAERQFGQKIGCHVGVIVVIAGNHVYRDIEARQFFLEILRLVEHGVPKLVPAAVSKAKGQKGYARSLRLRLGILQFFLETCTELLDIVARTIGKVTVGEEYGPVSSGIKGFKHKVVHLGNILVRADKTEKLSRAAIHRHPVPAWLGDHYIAVLAGGIDIIASVGVGDGGFDTIRNTHSLQGVSGIVYHTTIHCVAAAERHLMGVANIYEHSTKAPQRAAHAHLDLVHAAYKILDRLYGYTGCAVNCNHARHKHLRRIASRGQTNIITY